ncbi:serine protease [Methylotenera sp.]|uniref:serine protease n=1 Tax=Methylotenera sp. TaxID=2051956 RepID=UPI002731AA89|nr:serine protease [Methylotenera sp.]MDP2071637.1 trypsin-like peptidase domain-containing protein [Methylotenera sp.]MDP3006727.1 trypsin-like peptidase domain-containing protein [Methylotenera sp.]MDZ4211579.1 trypsin-like peptidase domain-containing protein [Methylotenera sp.]
MMRLHFLIKVTFFIGISQTALAEPSPELIYNLKGTIVKVHTVTSTGRQGSGSGVVVAENLVATNCHVLADSAGSNITAMGETYSPVGVRADWKHDVCILRFEFLPLKPAAFGDSNHLTYETSTFSVGFPGGAPKPLTTTGKIKALYPMDDSYVIRTSASFQMGASGSPLFDDQGKLIGMNTFKSPGANGYFYNVPAKWIKAAMNLPETDKVIQTDTPFWDATLEKRPYWMQVVLPMQAGKWQDLLTVASAWQREAPNDPEAIYYLALAQNNLGEVEQAKTKFERVLVLNPHHTSSILALAQIAKVQGAQTALKDFSRMLSVLDESSLDLLNPTTK